MRLQIKFPSTKSANDLKYILHLSDDGPRLKEFKSCKILAGIPTGPEAGNL